MKKIERIVRYENDFAVDLFPYKIQNREAFYFRNHPKNLNPRTTAYKRYWGDEFLRPCIEGKWVLDNDTWVFMYPVLFFYVNYTVIPDEDRNIINPRLRDNEWIMGTYDFCCMGFSGFEDDEEFTCNFLVDKVEKNIKLQSYEKKALLDDKSVYKADGSYKKFIDPWVYLTETYLITNKRNKPLGLPMYSNGYFNDLYLAARGCAKSYYIFFGSFYHDWLFSCVRRFDDRKLANNGLRFALGASKSDALARSLDNLNFAYANMPGKFLFPNPKRKGESIPFHGPYYKFTQGRFEVTDKKTTVAHIVKLQKTGKEIIKGSTAQIMPFKPNETKFLTGDRFRRGVIEEVGFVKNLMAIYNSSKDGMRVGKKWVGRLTMLGCVCKGTRVFTESGNIVNVEDIKIDNKLIGYSSELSSCVQQDIGTINPPTDAKCVKLTFSNGMDLECTTDHPIYTNKIVDGEKKECFLNASYLNKGDKIALPASVDFWGDYEMEEPRILGMVVGDGSYAEGQQVMFTSCDDALNDYVTDRYKVNTYYTSVTKKGKTLKKSKVSNLKPLLVKEGIYGQTKLNKRLPKNLFRATKKSVCEFIGGYFDTDGCISYNENNNYGVIKITSICKEMITDLTLLLQKLNIHGKIIEGKPSVSKLINGKNKTYNLYIKDAVSVVNFKENINLLIDYKQSNLDKFYEYKKDSYIHKFKRDNKFRWVKVVKVEGIGFKPVYNMMASGYHNYIANGVLTHNTGGDMEAIKEPKEMHENPGGYNVFGIPNYWIKDGDSSKRCSMFVGAYYKSEEFKDENGNTILQEALEDVINGRRKNKIEMNTKAFNEDLMWNPIYPKELLRPTVRSPLPIAEMNEWREYLVNNIDKWKKRATVGSLKYKNGEVVFQPDLENTLEPIFEWGKDGELHNKLGAWIFYEDAPSVIPSDMFYVLVDPIQMDGEGTSLMSILVYKRDFKIDSQDDSMRDAIVASYIGRYTLGGELDKNHDEVIKACLYFNGEGFPEMNAGSFAEYVRRKNLEKYMHKTPLQVIGSIKGSTYKSHQISTYKFGVKTNKEMNQWAITKLADWLGKPTAYNKDGIATEFNYQKIYDLRLLHELVNFDFDNKSDFDSVSALMLLPYIISEYDDQPVEIDRGEDEWDRYAARYEIKQTNFNYNKPKAPISIY